MVEGAGHIEHMEMAAAEAQRHTDRHTGAGQQTRAQSRRTAARDQEELHVAAPCGGTAIRPLPHYGEARAGALLPAVVHLPSNRSMLTPPLVHGLPPADKKKSGDTGKKLAAAFLSAPGAFCRSLEFPLCVHQRIRTCLHRPSRHMLTSPHVSPCMTSSF